MPGLISLAAQAFAGLKTFRDGIAAHIGTAGANDVAALFGTRVADGSVDSNARLLSVRTGIGGTEVEKAAVLGNGSIFASSAKFLGSDPTGNSYVSVGVGTASMLINAGAHAVQLSGSWFRYLGHGSQRFVVDATTGNLTAGGSISTGGPSGLLVGFAGVGVTASSFPLVLASGWGLADTSGTRALQLKSATTLVSGAIAGFYNGAGERALVNADGELENLVNGKGIILRSPNGTRYRITVDNSGNLITAAA
jgi:hypothetical protein